ncbi:MAG: hypothetical protein ACYCQJ_12920 [Nitrososphaerales archaeon]
MAKDDSDKEQAPAFRIISPHDLFESMYRILYNQVSIAIVQGAKPHEPIFSAVFARYADLYTRAFMAWKNDNKKPEEVLDEKELKQFRIYHWFFTEEMKVIGAQGSSGNKFISAALNTYDKFALNQNTNMVGGGSTKSLAQMKDYAFPTEKEAKEFESKVVSDIDHKFGEK